MSEGLKPIVVDLLEDALDRKVSTKNPNYIQNQNAVVSRITDDGVVWVRFPGSPEDTPSALSAAGYSIGDEVLVSIRNGSAYIDGNYSDPSVTNAELKRELIPISNAAQQARDISLAGEKVAKEAKAVAEATNQHFWSRSNDEENDGLGVGAFVTDSKQETFIAASKEGFPDSEETTDGFVGDGERVKFVLSSEAKTTDYIVTLGGQPVTSGVTKTTEYIQFDFAPAAEASIEVSYTANRPWHNLLMNSLGILLRRGKSLMASFTHSAVAFFDGNGNNAENIVARFGSDGAQIGKSDRERVVITSDGFTAYNQDNVPFFDVDYDGASSDERITKFIYKYGESSTSNTHYEVDLSECSTWTSLRFESRFDVDFASEYEGLYGIERGGVLPIEAQYIPRTKTVDGHTINLYFTEFYDNIDFHVDETFTSTLRLVTREMVTIDCQFTRTFSAQTKTLSLDATIMVNNPRVCPYWTVTPLACLAYGVVTTKTPSFTIGTSSGESGLWSTRIGQSLSAQQPNQTAIGKYNSNQQNSAFEIGNGTSDTARSNAFAVDWSGNVAASGDVTDGSGNVLSDKADTSTTYTKTEVDTALAGKANTATTYTKTEVNTALAGKADAADFDGIAKNRVLASPNGSTGDATFRALVAADLPTVPVNKGGTGQTALETVTKISDVITAESGVTINSVSYNRWGKMVMLNVNFARAAIANNTSVTIGEIVTGKRPKVMAYGGSAFYNAYITAGSTGGTLAVRNVSGASRTPTSDGISFTYLLP